jgi:hypothetical protein
VWLVVEARGRVDDALSQRRFDELRGALGHPRAPGAAQIARRLGMRWSELVQMAERSPQAVSRALYARTAVARPAGDPVARARWCTPPYLLGRLGILMLGSSALAILIAGIFVLALGVTLQAGATGAVRAIKMSAKLTVTRHPTGAPASKS